MVNVKQNFKKVVKEIVFWLILFVATFLLYAIVKPHLFTDVTWARQGVVAQSITVVLLLIIAIVAIILYINKKLNAKNIIRLLIIAGYIIRLGYMLITPANCRQHDTFTGNYDGHETYAWILYSTGKLPTSNVYQFYHPPLNAIVQSGFMHFYSGFTTLLSKIFNLDDYFVAEFLVGKPNYLDAERYALYGSCQILSLLYSVIACVYMVKIIKMFNFSNKITILASAFVIFFPRNYQMSAQLNNDALSFVLAILALFACLKWYKNGNKQWWIYGCALFCGLGIMTKLSFATICLPIGAIFVLEFIKVIRKKSTLSLSKILVQYGIFLVVCAPIGLWFQVYAKIRFNQNLGYVFDNLNESLSTKGHSLFSRFIFAFDINEWFGSIYANPFEDYSLYNYLVRTSIFGEFSYWNGEGYGLVALIAAYIACLLIIVDVIYCLVRLIIKSKKKEFSFKNICTYKGGDKLFIITLIFSQVISMYYFYLKMPFGCTMDFRYILPIILGFALGFGYIFKSLKIIGGKASRILSVSTGLVIAIYFISSSVFYTLCV